jgi:putative flippase GtrA
MMMSTPGPRTARQSSTPATARQREIGQILRFLVIGGTAVLIDLVVYTLLNSFIATALAKGASYVSGMAFSYVGNKHWTFGASGGKSLEPFTYACLYGSTLAINVAVNSAALFVLGGEQTALAFLIATGVTTILNYLGMRFLTRRPASGAA